MRYRATLVVMVAAWCGAAMTAAQEHVHPAAKAPAAARNAALPPDEEGSKAALNSSPRHGEWATIKAGSDSIKTWVVYPERKDQAPVVIVVHEIYGLTDWIRGVADQVAKEGFIAIAPDLLTGKGPNGGGTESVDRDGATKLIRALTPEEVVSRLNAARDYGLKLPAANGKSASIGFCWGGSTSFLYATAQPALDAAVVYYGTAPADAEKLAQIKAPVLGLYGGNDARVNATIAPTQEQMKKLDKVYEYQIFDGAGHGFLRAQTGQEGANMKATEQAWPRTVAFLKEHTGTKGT